MIARCACGRVYATESEWEQLEFHAHWILVDIGIDQEMRHCACRSTVVRVYTEATMAVSNHMIVGYNHKRVAVAVGYGDSFEAAEDDYAGPRNHGREDQTRMKIVEVVRYRRTDDQWQEVRDEKQP